MSSYFCIYNTNTLSPPAFAYFFCSLADCCVRVPNKLFRGSQRLHIVLITALIWHSLLILLHDISKYAQAFLQRLKNRSSWHL